MAQAVASISELGARDRDVVADFAGFGLVRGADTLPPPISFRFETAPAPVDVAPPEKTPT